ncbi:hypothetical protein VNO77_28331 [Canavalia gladiata]|uniref:Uncharacterized protein n=1 Tax=Canavalia gladiata TaxID=3824 RepID=A0AAN9Q7Q9_CANGL
MHNHLCFFFHSSRSGLGEWLLVSSDTVSRSKDVEAFSLHLSDRFAKFPIFGISCFSKHLASVVPRVILVTSKSSVPGSKCFGKCRIDKMKGRNNLPFNEKQSLKRVAGRSVKPIEKVTDETNVLLY